MINANLAKKTVWATFFAALLGMSACQKAEEDVSEKDDEADAVMSAEPAEGNDPAIVADDLDEVDAQSQQALDAANEETGVAELINDSGEAADDTLPAIDEAPAEQSTQ